MTRSRKPLVLCVDDEPSVLESLTDILRKRFEIVTTTNGFEGLRLLKERRFEVLLSDMRMPMLNGARFLALAREHASDTQRLLLTGQSNLEDAVAAVNDGEVFRFLVKPCGSKDLITALDAAVERHRGVVGQRERDAQSAHETVRAFVELAAAIDPTAPERAERLVSNARELAAQLDTAVSMRELDPACELMQLGAVRLSRDTLLQLSRGQRLKPEQGAELERLPEAARPFLASIPALQTVAVLLAATSRPFVPTVPGAAGTPAAARVLRIVVDFDALECQGLPAHAALRALRAREGRYDPALLDAFAGLWGVSASSA